jgi:hypothetical protein
VEFEDYAARIGEGGDGLAAARKCPLNTWEPESRNPRPKTRNPRLETRNPKSEALKNSVSCNSTTAPISSGEVGIFDGGIFL